MIYQITLTPARPYFFGNDKRFTFRADSDSTAKKESDPAASYYITGEKIPLQTTIFGALRYLLVPNKGFGLAQESQTENDKVIGSSTFDPTSVQEQEFGIIHGISPLVIINKQNGHLLIPTPFDHKEKHLKKIRKYDPFCDYHSIVTSDGTRLFAQDYDVKKGLTDSWIDLYDGKLVWDDELFGSEIRVGINLKASQEGYFKREFTILKRPYAFCFYAEINDEQKDGWRGTVLMGQGRTPFTVKFSKVDQYTLPEVAYSCLQKYRKNTGQYAAVYCLSDFFMQERPFGGTLFAAVKTRDFRSIKTDSRGGVSRSDQLYRLLRAGSILMFKDEKQAQDWIKKYENEQTKTAGMNCFLKMWEGADNKLQLKKGVEHK